MIANGLSDATDTLIADTVRSHPRPGSNSNGNLAIAFASKAGGGGSYRMDGLSPTLSAHGTDEGGQPPAVTDGASVRRLTPTECLRLQALPDDWFDGVPGSTDSKKYAGLGDAVTASVAEFIGVRILESA